MKFLKELSKKIAFNDILATLFIIFIIGILNLIRAFGQVWFTDFSIIYEGGYRIFTGQVPYVDFYTSVGPVVFYIQAFFNYLFGPTLLAMAVHTIFLSSILTILFYILIRKKLNIILSVIFSISFYLSYYGLIGIPWYNQTALFFFLLNVLIILLYNMQDNKKIYFLSYILAALSFFSKQDIGIYYFVMLGIYFWFTNKKNIKGILLLYILPFIISVTGLSLFFNRENGFLIESVILSKIFGFINPIYIIKIISSPYIYLMILFIFLIFKTNDQLKVKIYSIIILITSVCLLSSATSDLNFQTIITGFPIIIYLCYTLIAERINLRDLPLKLLNFIFFIILILAIFSYHYYMYHDKSQGVLEGYARDFNRIINSNPQEINSLKYNPVLDYKCSKGILLENYQNKKDLDKIRYFIEINNYSFINMGDYTFLYCDYDLPAPKKVPLWYHYGISYSDDEVIIDYIKKEKPKLILIPVSGEDENDHRLILIDKFKAMGYSIIYQTDKIGGFKFSYVMKLKY